MKKRRRRKTDEDVWQEMEKVDGGRGGGKK